MKKVLITGEDSYIGINVAQWLNSCNQKASENSLEKPYEIVTISVFSDEANHGEWEKFDFGKFDVVFHVAGIAHADIGNVSEETKKLYYRINTDLALAVAKKALKEGCKQFIYMSSMIVYGNERFITNATVPNPSNFYGDSKWQADKELQIMNTDAFHVVILRPPMIYGKGSKGNFPILAKMASKLPCFPVVKNQRSMLHIDNLCEFIRLVIDNNDSGVFFPQNAEYTNTSQMVKEIANVKGHKIIMIHGVAWLIRLMMHIPGKIGGLLTKAFGSSYYALDMSEYKMNYRVHDLRESIVLTEMK